MTKGEDGLKDSHHPQKRVRDLERLQIECRMRERIMKLMPIAKLMTIKADKILKMLMVADKPVETQTLQQMLTKPRNRPILLSVLPTKSVFRGPRR